MALLVLRVALLIGILLATEAASILHPAMTWISSIVGICLCIGVATPLCAAICFFGAVFLAAKGDGGSVVCSSYSACVAAAVVLLGPGAYSLDALLFGRKRVLLKNHDNKSRGAE